MVTRCLACLLVFALLAPSISAQVTYVSEDSLDVQIGLKRLIQWRIEDGGNGHWYGIIDKTMPWVSHQALASALSIDGEPGYLATITSLGEQIFIQRVIADWETDNVANEFYIGGEQVAGTEFRWITGEPFDYQNWAPGEPNSLESEDALAIWNNVNPVELRYAWNNVPSDTTGLSSIHQLWSIVEFGAPDSVPGGDEPLVQLRQWRSADGGNDHWYGIIPLTRPWVTHDSIARSLMVHGDTGYLATIVSPEEDQFVQDLIADVPTNAVNNQYYLGGRWTDSFFVWLTGESFTYQNWAPGEPNNTSVEDAVSIWNNLNPSDRANRWNNVPSDTIPLGSIHQLWAVVEFGESGSMTALTESHLSNFPNPFNPVTTIMFNLESSGEIRLEVYNVLGQKVANLIDGFREAGNHTVLWDASAYASGVYFYRLRTQTATITRSMVLLK